ncbi:MAG: DNA primase [Tidjanibacter sp.]|nr:DNA primase [Tidjanibacter sp.]MBQ5931167.1 DNA primase [Tidjanibacter sp.]
MIDRATQDKIYAAANIVEVISDFVSLKKKGVNYSACCPFHNEKTPSFVVSPSKGLYKCFGCGKGGNAITFVMEHERLTYPEALKWVAKKYGITVEEREETPEEKQRNDDRESMLVANAWASDYFLKSIFETDEGLSVARSYFASRGLTDATIRKFGLGYCPGRGDVMTQAALKAGYKEKYLVDTGLTIKRETGGYYDRFCGRAMFPIHTISGRVTAFSGRALSADNKAKYVNSPESPVYSKSNNLYGIYFAKSAIAKENLCILVEGNVDVVQMHQKGIENVVAPLGTALTVEQVRIIARFTNNITLLFDGDSAGVKAAIKGVDLVLKEGLNVRVVVLPEGEDPDSYARSHTAEQVREYIRTNERDFIRFKSELYAEQVRRDPIRKAELISDMVASIALIPDSIQRSIFIKECAEIMGTEVELLSAEVIRKRMGTTYDSNTNEFVRNQQMQQKVEQKELTDIVSLGKYKAGSSMSELEKELVGFLIKYGHCSLDYRDGRERIHFNVAHTIINDIEGDGVTFLDSRYRAILECYKQQRELLPEGEKVPEHFFIEMDNPEASSAAVDILTENDNYKQSRIWKDHDIYIESEEERLGRIIPKTILLYKSKYIEVMIEEKQRELAALDDESDEYMDVLTQINNLLAVRTKMAEQTERNIL